MLYYFEILDHSSDRLNEPFFLILAGLRASLPCVVRRVTYLLFTGSSTRNEGGKGGRGPEEKESLSCHQ